MALIAGISFVTGALFMSLGAWPVAGFLGLDVLAVYWAFRVNFKEADNREIIEITNHEIVLTRLKIGHQPKEVRFTRAWVKIELDENPGTGMIDRLSLTMRGRRVFFGDFLSSQERKSLAEEMRLAAAQRRV